MGVSRAVRAVREELAPAVVGYDATEQERIDALLVAADGTDDLSTYGANALLAVSGGVARSAASARGEPLYEYLTPSNPETLPRPMVNVVSGGLHAHGGIAVQDLLVLPTAAETYSEAIESVWDVRRCVEKRIAETGTRPLVADEGGFSPPFDRITDAFELLCAGISAAGFVPAIDGMAIAVDVAATHFYDPGTERYDLETEHDSLSREGMIARLLEWVETYPIVSLEDPLSEDDWEGWRSLADRLPAHVQLVGDDLLVTDHSRVDRAIDEEAATSVLVKMNQAGTLTRTTKVLERAQNAGLSTIVSARSGETCDSTLADLAVAYGSRHLKVGSLARSERLAKYNRLFEIERELGPNVAVGGG